MESAARPRFSIVIPTLDEELTIEDTLRRARSAFGDSAELIVVDGGSRDGTPTIARGSARVVTAPRGRGAQLRSGGEQARGELVVFLHADTHLEPDSAARVQSAFEDPGVVVGHQDHRMGSPSGRRAARAPGELAGPPIGVDEPVPLPGLPVDIRRVLLLPG